LNAEQGLYPLLADDFSALSLDHNAQVSDLTDQLGDAGLCQL
jgi:hypothetical protein